jgi:hypothetical protein
VVFEVRDQVHRLEGLAGERRGAVVGAAAALGAGQAVEELLPAQVLEGARAEVLDVLGLGVDLQGADLALGGEVHEEHVQRRGEHVAVFAVGHVVGEGEQVEQVAPPGGAVAEGQDALVRREDALRQQRAEPGVALGQHAGGLAAEGHLEADLRDLEQHQAQDEEQRVHRVPREVQALGFDDRAVHEGHDQAHDAEEPEGVRQGLVGARRAGQLEQRARLAAGGDGDDLQQAVDDEVHRVRAEDHEGAEDEDVQDAAVPVAVLREPLLRHDVDEEVPDAGWDLVPAHFRAFGHEELADAHPHGQDEEDAAGSEDGQESDGGEPGSDGMVVVGHA